MLKTKHLVVRVDAEQLADRLARLGLRDTKQSRLS